MKKKPPTLRPTTDEQRIARISKVIGYIFSDPNLLRLALTHSSMDNKDHNERLEFLGDSILNTIISQELYARYPKADEGQLTRLRAKLVNSESLLALAQKFDLREQIILGPSELKTGGRDRRSILADSVEALVAAMYLDSDFETCRKYVLNWYQDRFENLQQDVRKDSKTQLQEFLQARRLALPEYILLRTDGKAHEQEFFVECRLISHPIVEQGHGPSRRLAEQEAAAAVLSYIAHHPEHFA